MALEIKAGQVVRVTISKSIGRASARKTIERLFLKDKAIVKPIRQRSRNFISIPKRRGGCVWTKRPNMLHPDLECGAVATIRTTAQSLRDLASVEGFVTIVAA